MWRALRSLVRRVARRETAVEQTPDCRTLIVALLGAENDQQAVQDAAARESLHLHFAGSCEQALRLLETGGAPVIIFDRNWPGVDWRAVVRTLSRAPGRPCVLLASGVVDEYLWQEVIRRGGYDVLAKPLRAEEVARALRLALSYWAASPRPEDRDPRPVSVRR